MKGTLTVELGTWRRYERAGPRPGAMLGATSPAESPLTLANDDDEMFQNAGVTVRLELQEAVFRTDILVLVVSL